MADTRSVSLTDRGRRRNNEDFAAHFEPDDPVELEKSGCLYIIADGVGGAAKGERASQFAAQKVLYEYYRRTAIEDPGERLREIMEGVNDDIHAFAAENRTRMATTMVAAAIRAGLLYLANVGDSRAYLIRDGHAKQLNHDHSLVGEMVASGEMTEAEAAASKIKNRLTRSLGGEADVNVEVYPPLELAAGEKILLCSDGLTRYALRPDIEKFTAEGTLEEIAQNMVGFANERGGADNISVVVVSYQGQGLVTPTIPIRRPESVELQTLITQPDVSELSRNRQSMTGWLLTLGLIAAIVGGAAAVLIVPPLRALVLGPPPTAMGTGFPKAELLPPALLLASGTDTAMTGTAVTSLPAALPVVATEAPTFGVPDAVPRTSLPEPVGTVGPFQGTVSTWAPWAYVRAGPGTAYQSIDQLYDGQPFTALARNADASWLRISYVKNGPLNAHGQSTTGWISKSIVDINSGDDSELPVMDLPPVPMATPTE